MSTPAPRDRRLTAEDMAAVVGGSPRSAALPHPSALTHAQRSNNLAAFKPLSYNYV